MKVIIMSCSKDNYWYKDKIGKTYDFIKKDNYFCYVTVKGDIRKILINDCQIY
ncbi:MULTISPECIES: hypothetical protein [Clostridium]|uniref:hypothetical protein n=1 Tax=Clostridium TaxID=1485 RepID=UPI001586C4B1|nr:MULTISPECIES: hypothetical protein [Clostridium]